MEAMGKRGSYEAKRKKGALLVGKGAGVRVLDVCGFGACAYGKMCIRDRQYRAPVRDAAFAAIVPQRDAHARDVYKRQRSVR